MVWNDGQGRISMTDVIVTTQAEYDALPAQFEVWTRIVIKNDARCGRIVVVARGNSSVEAWGNSSVEAWGNSSVVARGNSSVVAWENSSVVARGNVGVHLHSEGASVEIWAFAVCWVLAKKWKVTAHSKTATVIHPKQPVGNDGWLEGQGVAPEGEHVILFKRVSAEWKTQEGKPSETTWSPGLVLEHPAWSPASEECGGGKFHACSRPYFCDEFRYEKRDDRYVAIKIAVADLHAWEGESVRYPHKIAFRAGEVLYECDKHGREVKAKGELR